MKSPSATCFPGSHTGSGRRYGQILCGRFCYTDQRKNRSSFLSRKSSSAKSRRLSSPGQLKILVIKWTGQWSTEQRPEPWRRMTRPRPRGWVGVYSNGARRPWYITVVIRQTMLCNAMRCSKQQAASGWCRDGGNKKRPQLEKQQQVRRGNRCWCEVPVQIRMRG